MTEEEARAHPGLRIDRGVRSGARPRLLLATAGGPNALAGAPLAFGLTKKSSAAVKILHVEAELAWWQHLFRPFARRAPASVNDQHREDAGPGR